MTNNPSAAAQAQATAAVSAPSVRQAYVDTFRGLLIAHMGLDHASLMFNAGRAGEELAAGPAPMFGDIADVRAHGRDERVGIAQFYDGQDFLYRLVKRYSTGK